MAGILDSLLSGNADPGAGLLSFLNSLQQGAPASQMGPLPSDTAQYGGMPAAQAPVFAQQNAQPSPLDTAQYPAGPIGAPSQANAQMQQPAAQMPMQQVTAPIAPQPQAPAAQGPGFLDRVNANLQSLAHGGSLLGTLTGNLTDPASKAAQVQNLTFKALTAKGVDPQIAAAAIAPGNTEMLKTLITKAFGPQTPMNLGSGYILPPGATTAVRAFEPDDKFQHVTRKDQFGGEETGSFDPSTGKVTFPSDNGGATGSATGVQGMIDNIAQKRTAGASRADLIKEVPPAYQGYISSLLDGKAVPANIGRGQARGAIMTLAHAVDPTFDETMIPARITTARDFTPQGKSGASIVAFNTVQHHIGKLSDDFENLGTAGQGGFQTINSLRNSIATQTPLDPTRQKAVQAVNDDIKAVTDEMSAAYKAGHVSDTEIKSWNSLVNSNLPLPQARQAISDFVDLLNGKRDALNRVHQQIMGGDAAIIDKDENTAITQKVHNRNNGTAVASKPTTVTQNGHTYNLQPDGSYQ